MSLRCLLPWLCSLHVSHEKITRAFPVIPVQCAGWCCHHRLEVRCRRWHTFGHLCFDVRGIRAWVTFTLAALLLHPAPVVWSAHGVQVCVCVVYLCGRACMNLSRPCSSCMSMSVLCMYLRVFVCCMLYVSVHVRVCVCVRVCACIVFVCTLVGPTLHRPVHYLTGVWQQQSTSLIKFQ